MLKNFLHLLVALLLAAVALALYGWAKSNTKPTERACTLEARICPDGSAVGRQGPSCEFAPCPGEPSIGEAFDNREVDFTREGVLTRDNTGTESGLWYLMYEAPGSETLTTKLSFDAQSMCGGVTCNPNTLIADTNVRVEGIAVEGAVLVRVLHSVE